mgnify:FL=1
MMPANELAAVIVKALDAKKGENIQLLKTRELTTLADYFVICTASSSTHVKTLTDADVQAMAKKVLSDGNLVKVIMRPAKEEAK